MSNDKTLQPLAGMTLEEMQDAVTALGMPRFVAKQLAQWIYQKRVNDFEQMLNISKANRELLASRYCVGLYPPSQASSTCSTWAPDRPSSRSIFPRKTVPRCAFRPRRGAG